jgi:hypothetical protein
MTELSVYDVYKQDTEYQNFMNEFNQKKARFELMANQGLYKKEHLQEVAKKLHGDLQKFLLNHRTNQLNEIQGCMEALENQSKKLGLSERSDDVKEFEMKFRLANDFELKRMVEDLKTEDLLELSLLRMELKNRGLDKEDISGNNYDAKVKRYIGEKQIDGMTDADRKAHRLFQEEANIYRSMGAGFVVGENTFQHIDSIQRELNQTANKVVNDKAVVRNVIIDQF